MNEREFGGRIGRYWDESEPWWPPVERASSGSPNVLMVVLDDVGFAQIGCYGSDLSTPTFDSLAQAGLRFTNFHTTAVCSATRACLLTGRNHHSSGMGRVIEVASGFPGYNALIPRGNGFLSEVLRSTGFSTYAVGKWHLTPEDQCHSAGRRDRWPLGRGFDRFFGFMGGETHQFVPSPVEDNHLITRVDRVRDDYHLTEDLVDKAIEFVRDGYVVDPKKPFFLYLAPGACHAPHQVLARWIDPYRGRFDEGWDTWRERTLTRQIESGVMGPGTGLSPRRPGSPRGTVSRRTSGGCTRATWRCTRPSCPTPTNRWAGSAGSSRRPASSTTPSRSCSRTTAPAPRADRPARCTCSGVTGPARPPSRTRWPKSTTSAAPQCHANYPWGWTMAGNTPFQRWKREVHEGGVADPFIVHWPPRVADPGGFRRQYVHAIDVMPTVLELAGLEAPGEIDGVVQAPLDGVSFASVYDDAGAGEVRSTQYYEMFGNRALYHDGWKAVAHHPYMNEPGSDRSFEDDTWELYHVAEDVSECVDLAAQRPDKLRELIDRWWIEAGHYQVLPLDNPPISDFVLDKPPSVTPRSEYVYLSGAAAVPEAVAVNVKNRSHLVLADVVLPVDDGRGAASGILLSQGSLLGGWSLYLDDGRLAYVHNLGAQEFTYVRSPERVPAGRHVLGFRFERTGHNAGRGSLLVDDRVVAQGEISRFTPVRFSATGAGLTCGYGNGMPVSDEFEGSFPFDGVIEKVTVLVDGPPFVDPAGEATVAITSQ